MSAVGSQRIGTRAAPACPLCGAAGISWHRGLPDRLQPGVQAWDFSRCARCGLLWLDPMPIAADLARAYGHGYYTHDRSEPERTWYRRAYYFLRRGYLAWRLGYARREVPWWQRGLGALMVLYPRRRADMDFAAMHLPAREGGRLLEVGCGGGRALRVLEELGWAVEGLDFDPDAVESARRRGLNVRQGTLAEAGYPEDHFHAVVMSHVIEHLPDPRALLRECRRVLASDGTLVVITPNAGSWGHALFGPHWFSLEPPRHTMVFDPDNLRRLVDEEGFAVRTLVTTRRWAREIWSLSREIRARGHLGGRRRRTWAERVGGLLFELAEAARLTWGRPVGEEILLIATPRKAAAG
ncbi:MAG TPA: methyltransferase domain-containing protein [Vicinamibacteria bacterium]